MGSNPTYARSSSDTCEVELHVLSEIFTCPKDFIKSQAETIGSWEHLTIPLFVGLYLLGEFRHQTIAKTHDALSLTLTQNDEY